MTEKATDRQTDYLVDGEPNIAIQACIIHIPKSCNAKNLTFPNDTICRFESDFRNQVDL